MYADIGPLSIKRRPCTSTLNQEDQRVEYTLLNFKAQKNAIPKVSQKLDDDLRRDTKACSSEAGIIIILSPNAYLIGVVNTLFRCMGSG